MATAKSAMCLVVVALAIALATAEVRRNPKVPSMPIYGNWCGPNYGDGTPVDDVDACCMTHDHCYDRKGWGSCACDWALKACASKAELNGNKGLGTLAFIKVIQAWVQSKCKKP